MWQPTQRTIGDILKESINQRQENFFKLAGVSVLFAKFIAVADGDEFSAVRNHGDGMFSICPTRSLFGFTPGFAACNALNLIPNFRAMAASVSPEATACVRGATGFAGWLTIGFCAGTICGC